MMDCSTAYLRARLGYKKNGELLWKQILAGVCDYELVILCAAWVLIIRGFLPDLEKHRRMLVPPPKTPKKAPDSVKTAQGS